MPYRRVRTLLVASVVLGLISAAVAWQSQVDDAAPGLLPALRAPAKFWKGNLHTHSFWSDGDDFPEMIADWYKRHGYQFLALTDHNILAEGHKWVDIPANKGERALALKKYQARFGANWVETRTVGEKLQARLKPLAEYRSLLEEPSKFLLVPGEEVTHRFAASPVHINAINVRDVITPGSGASVSETIQVNLRAVAEQQKKTNRGMVAFLNHPNFYWSTRAEDMLVEELRYFEVFNGHSSVRNYGDKLHPSTETLWDIALALRLGKLKLPGLFGLATDDAHAYHVFGVGKTNPGRGWIMVRAPHLSAEALVQAITVGDYYASTGVTLDDVTRTGGALKLSIHGQPGVKYKTQFIATLKDTPLDSTPRTDAEGTELAVTRNYHADVGKVVAEFDGLTAAYELTGKELYVRARITSTKLHPNPFQKGDVEMAWTQPLVP